jgi:hypothetical protein
VSCYCRRYSPAVGCSALLSSCWSCSCRCCTLPTSASSYINHDAIYLRCVGRLLLLVVNRSALSCCSCFGRFCFCLLLFLLVLLLQVLLSCGWLFCSPLLLRSTLAGAAHCYRHRHQPTSTMKLFICAVLVGSAVGCQSVGTLLLVLFLQVLLSCGWLFCSPPAVYSCRCCTILPTSASSDINHEAIYLRCVGRVGC